MMQKNRLEWLDVAKGITIILVMLGHTSIPQIISNFIYSFHMPLFFIASGWCTNWDKNSFTAFTLRKLRTLLVPFLVYSIIVANVSDVIQYNPGRFSYVIHHGWEGYALWFVPVLLSSSILVKLIFQVHKKIAVIILSLVLLIFGSALNYCHIYLPWTVCTIPYASFLLVLGHYLKNYSLWIEKPRWVIFAICFVITLIISSQW